MYFDVVGKIFKEEGIDTAKLAFACADRDLTWGELKKTSLHVTELLAKAGVKEGQPVMVYGNKEAWFIASLLACYCNNIPFVPATPDLPPSRLEKMMLLCQCKVLINCSPENISLPVEVIIDSRGTISGDCTNAPAVPNAAYILFTSGSTGEPKGVVISNRNIQAFVNWFCQNFPVGKESVFANCASFGFDIALADFFATLQTGASAVLHTAQMLQSGQVPQRLVHYQCNYWNSTPSYISLLLNDKTFNAQQLPSLKTFTLSGEDLRPLLIKEVSARFREATFINAYGPTETTIFVSRAVLSPALLKDDSLPIGDLENEYLRLENDEIVIGGAQVGRYLEQKNDPACFATGDKGILKNGYIYYGGRLDRQIKFNGYRIEPDEVRHCLEKMPGVRQAECLPVVVDQKVKRLIVFVVTKDANLDQEKMRQQLKQELPAWMQPSEIILLESFPLTISSKTDRAALLKKYTG